MNVVIVGCGRIGAALAGQLYHQGHQVTVIDQSEEAFDNLPLDFHGRVVEGDVLAQNVLQRAEVGVADALAVVTRSDSLNALVAHIAQAEYGVKRVVARNYDPRHRQLQEAFGIPVVGSAGWGVQMIEEMLTEGPLHAVLLDGNAHFAVYRLEAPESWKGKKLTELLKPNAVKVLSWTRGGRTIPLSDSQVVRAGDLIYLSTSLQELEELRQRLGLEQEAST